MYYHFHSFFLIFTKLSLPKPGNFSLQPAPTKNNRLRNTADCVQPCTVYVHSIFGKILMRSKTRKSKSDETWWKAHSKTTLLEHLSDDANVNCMWLPIFSTISLHFSSPRALHSRHPYQTAKSTKTTSVERVNIPDEYLWGWRGEGVVLLLVAPHQVQPALLLLPCTHELLC